MFMLESLYDECLRHELTKSAIAFQHQVRILVQYDDVQLHNVSFADIIVPEQVVLDLKAADQVLPVHETHPQTYLRLTGCEVGLLINFNTLTLADGIRRRAMS